MKIKDNWIECKTGLPPQGVKVETKIDDASGERNRQTLARRGGLWFAGDIYVYYTPTHWQPIAP